MKRPLVTFCLSFIGLLGSLVILYSTLAERAYDLRGYLDASRDFNLPFRVPRLGVNVELTQYSFSELEQQLDLMESANVVWIRQVVPWSTVEPEAGQFQWGVWDRIFNALKQHSDLHVIAVLNTTPLWSRRIDTQPTAPPVKPSIFGEFSRAFAARYGDVVDYYQIWDEPNLETGWGGLEPSPTAYVALLAATYKAIHDSDSQATIIAAALAPTVESGPKNISDLLFLRDMYGAGAKGYLDAIAAKPYGFNTSPEDRTANSDTLNFSRVILLREEMLRHGDGKKAIWISNWGWNSLPKTWDGSPSIWGSVESDSQIDFTLGALDRAEREWPWVAGMTLQHWQPAVSSNDPAWGFALINQNDEPTPLLRALAGHHPAQVAQNGLYAAVNPFANYSGVWTFGELGADIGWVQDSQFVFDFAGSDVSLLLRQDNYTAYLYPKIDDQPANAAPRDSSSNAYIVLTSPSLKPEMNLIPVARNLPPYHHKLHIIADRGWDRWAIAGFGVSDGDLTNPYDRQAFVACLAIVITAFSTLVTGYHLNWSLIGLLFESLKHRLSISIQLVLSVLTSLALLLGMLLTWGDGAPAILRREPVPMLFAFLSAGLLKLQPGFIVTVITLLILFFFIYNHLFIGLVLTIFWSPFFLFPVELYRFSFPLSEVIILLTGAAWCIRGLANIARQRQSLVSQFPGFAIMQYRASITWIDFVVILWTLIAVVSLSWAEHSPQAVTELRVMILEPVIFYLVFRTSRLDRRQIQIIISAFLLAGLTVAIIGLWQYFQGEAVITAEAGTQRLASVYGSPNNVALFLGRCIPFLVAFTLLDTAFRRRLFYIFTLILLGIAILLTQSVGAIFLGVPLSIMAVCLLMLGKRGRYVSFFLLVILVMIFTFSLRAPRFARALDFSSGTNFYRLRVWESALNVIRDYPVTGLGLDQFLYAFRSHYIMPDAWQEPNLSHPHNIVLDFWVRLGVMGVIILIWMQAAFWKTALRLYKHYRRSSDHYITYAIIVGTIGSMVNLLGHGLVDNSVFVQDLSYVFVMLLGLVAAISKQQKINEPEMQKTNNQLSQ